MRIIGHGIDVVQVESIKKLLDSPHRKWAEKTYSPAERDLAGAPPTHIRFYAGRFAAKEAVAKALGTGFAKGVSWRNVEILRLKSGAPTVLLTGTALKYANKLGVIDWKISISHSGPISIASAIAVGE